MSCGAMTIGSDADCDEIANGGTVPRLILFNYDDIGSFDEDDDGTITAINLLAGKNGYEFTGFRSDVSYSEEVVKPEIGVARFKHLTGFVVYETNQEQKNNIET